MAPDIMANWRPARPQARPTPGPAVKIHQLKNRIQPQAPKGPVMPPGLKPAQRPAPPQQVPVQPEASAPELFSSSAAIAANQSGEKREPTEDKPDDRQAS